MFAAQSFFPANALHSGHPDTDGIYHITTA